MQVKERKKFLVGKCPDMDRPMAVCLSECSNGNYRFYDGASIFPQYIAAEMLSSVVPLGYTEAETHIDMLIKMGIAEFRDVFFY